MLKVTIPSLPLVFLLFSCVSGPFPGPKMNYRVEASGQGRLKAPAEILVALPQDASLSPDYQSGTGRDIALKIARTLGKGARAAGEYLSYDKALAEAYQQNYDYLVYLRVKQWSDGPSPQISVVITFHSPSNGQVSAQGTLYGWGRAGSLPPGAAPAGFTEALEPWLNNLIPGDKAAASGL